MSGKLKIYACSGIGSTDAQKRVGYWLDGTNTLSNTQAVNTLLARINEKYITATRLIGISNSDKIALLNDVDLLQVALEAAKRFKGSDEQLRHAGEVICEMWKNGDFELDTLDAREREDHLDYLLGKFDESVADTTPVQNLDQDFMDWWQETVVARNKCGLNFGQDQLARKALKKATEDIKEQIKGIGKVDWSQYQNGDWLENPDLAKYLTDGATYFLYTYFTDEQLAKLPSVFKKKCIGQKKVYNYCKALFVTTYGTEQDMRRIIEAGIMDELQVTPEQYCEEVVTGKRDPNAVGFLFGAETAAAGIKMLIELLAVIATLVVGIVSAICSMVAQTNVAKYAALDKKAVETNVPDASDYDGLTIGDQNPLGVSNKLITVAIIAAGALLLLRN